MSVINSPAVTSVFGRGGDIVAVDGDYSLTQLTDVTISAPTLNQLLTYNGTTWVNQAPSSGAVSSVFGRTGTVVSAEGDYSLNQLSDVTIVTPTTNQHLVYNGTTWVNQTVGGGADPWTILKLAADFSTTSATAVAVTGLNFTPSANIQYLVEGLFLLRTATTTVGPMPGCTWPTGLTDGVVMFDVTSAAGTRVLQNGNISAAVLSPVGGLPNTTASFPGSVYGTFRAGATPSGNFQITLASETAGTSVTMKAGSFIRYRTI